jgi:hypothetical protein
LSIGTLRWRSDGKFHRHLIHQQVALRGQPEAVFAGEPFEQAFRFQALQEWAVLFKQVD